ncbi:MAG: hypothetical protein WAK66_05285, partial [Methylocystis sp.]
MSYDEEDGKATPWDRARVFTQGDRVIWVDRGAKSYSALSRGNPKNLRAFKIFITAGAEKPRRMQR